MEIVQDLEDLFIQEDQNAVFMCEVSLEEVTGEWYKDGHKIRPTSTIKIRTEGQRKRFNIVCRLRKECLTTTDLQNSTNIYLYVSGTKHFLLMCNVKAEDGGEIHFVARDVESTAFLEVEGKFIF